MLEAAIVGSCRAARLQPEPAFVSKVVQLHETCNVRFGVMLVGAAGEAQQRQHWPLGRLLQPGLPLVCGAHLSAWQSPLASLPFAPARPRTAGSGKSSAYRTLRAALTQLRQQGSNRPGHQVVHTHVLNPKALTIGELYGPYNLATDEWSYGLASSLIRAAAADASGEQHWVVFDGPVDALWVENLNTGAWVHQGDGLDAGWAAPQAWAGAHTHHPPVSACHLSLRL